MLKEYSTDNTPIIGSIKNVRYNGTVNVELVGRYGGIVSGIVLHSNVPHILTGTYLNFTERRWRSFKDSGIDSEQTYIEPSIVPRHTVALQEAIAQEEVEPALADSIISSTPDDTIGIRKEVLQAIIDTIGDSFAILLTTQDFVKTNSGIRISQSGMSRGIRVTNFQKSLLEEVGINML